MTRPPIYGLLAEFDDPTALVQAVRRARAEGYRRLDAYSPFPVEELFEALELRRDPLPRLVLAGGVLGGLAGYLLQWWTSAHAYPLNVGGRPLHSWPAFIPVTYEMTILGAAIAAVLGFFAVCGLPMPYHPLFNAPRFALSTRDRFFLCIEATDRRFDPERTREFLAQLSPREITAVAH